MSDPRFRPRTYSSEPRAFGVATTIGWKEASPGDETELATAQLQHALSVTIRRAATNRYGSVSAYANHLGQTPDRLAKVLRGEAIMRLEDVAAAQLHLDVGALT